MYTSRAVMATLAVLLTIILFSASTTAAPAPIEREFSEQVDLSAVSRVANFDDVPHTFTSSYKFSGQCPDTITMSGLKVDTARHIGSVPITSIVENGKPCTGGKVMYLVSEATMKKKGLLAQLGFAKAAAALNTNSAAAATVRNRKKTSSLLVGFDEAARNCNGNIYPDNTFYFFIREPDEFKISITGADKKRTAIAIPPNTRALFITTSGRKICLLTDATTSGGRSVVITTSGPSKKPSASPKPSVSPTPSTKSVVAPVVKPSKTPSPSPSISSDSKDGKPGPSITVPVPAVSPESSPGVDDRGPNGSGNGATATDAPTVAPSPASGTNANTAICFPGSATVELENGNKITMAQLKIGDRVRTGDNSFSDVFMFTHRERNSHNRFVRLNTKSGASVTLTSSHYLFVDGSLRAAGTVKTGEFLRIAGHSTSPVSSIEHVSAVGLYNPQTIDGNVVVNGVVTSTYTTTVHPVLAHNVLLVPLRYLYSQFGNMAGALDALTDFISSSTEVLARLVPGGPTSLRV